MNKIPTITTQLLSDLDACIPQLNIFKRLWPEGASITSENIEKAAQ